MCNSSSASKLDMLFTDLNRILLCPLWVLNPTSNFEESKT